MAGRVADCALSSMEANPYPVSDVNECPICYSSKCALTLSCGHSICKPCANQASESGHAKCPICRAPHILDTQLLGERAAVHRSDYAAFRAGAAKGSKGELSNISAPDNKAAGLKGKSLHSTSAGDLAMLGEGPAGPLQQPPKVLTSDACKASADDLTALLSDFGVARPLPLGFAIVGMGRAGRIHLDVLSKAAGEGTARVRYLVDVNPAAVAPPPDAETKVVSDIAAALASAAVDCVVVSTPTPSHAPIIRAALEAGKHVFAEKPLCCGSEAEVRALFELASARGLLLHTAYNRRHDPLIQEARREVRSGEHGAPLGASLVSRDFPYPPAAYLALSGNIFKDCVVHDLDYLTWLLDDEVVSLCAHASTGDDPAAVARACGMWEYSEVHLQLRSGATATLVNGRVSTSYEHRLDIYCEHGVVRVANPYADTPGKAFSDRFADSYHHQLRAFCEGVRAVRAGAEAAALCNLSLERTLLLDQLVRACEKSVAGGGTRVAVLGGEACDASNLSSPRSVEAAVEGAQAATAVVEAAAEEPAAALRTYGDETAARVKQLYQTMRQRQSVEHVRLCREKYCTGLGTVRMGAMEALELLNRFVDVSDPDVTLPNMVHAFQTAEGVRAMKLPDWLQLTGLIHDLGKMMAFVKGCDEDGTSVSAQWSIVGDTWVVGCAMPDCLVFPEFNAASPDAQHAERTTETGIYEPGCGLDRTLCAFGHDEYMYQVLSQNEGVTLPKEALYVIRYHSLYPWHDGGAYAALESDYDRQMKGWVKLFNQHDLYTKRDVTYSDGELAAMKVYYAGLVKKYLPAQLLW